MLRPKWNDLCQRLKITNPQVFFDSLADHYSEPHRHYHTLNHLHFCLQELVPIRTSLNNPEAVELALWFHDIIYTIGKNDNEEKSAKTAVQFCQKNKLSPDFTKQVEDHILATKHVAVNSNLDSQYLADADMAILGQPPNIFDKYEKQIYQEYSTLFSKRNYQKGRTNFLKTVLEHSIYTTDFFKNKYEQSARSNIQRVINNLTSRLLRFHSG